MLMAGSFISRAHLVLKWKNKLTFFKINFALQSSNPLEETGGEACVPLATEPVAGSSGGCPSPVSPGCSAAGQSLCSCWGLPGESEAGTAQPGKHELLKAALQSGGKACNLAI